MSDADKLESKVCPRCEKVLSLRANPRDHYRSGACQRRYKSRTLEAAGYAKVDAAGFVARVIQKSGIDLKREPTGAALRGVLQMQSWTLKWALALLEQSWVLTEGFPESEVTPVYASAIRKASEDPDYLAALRAAIRLNGQRGLRNFILEPAFRANKMREDGRAAAEKARALFAAADMLDPREEMPPCAVCVCRTIDTRVEIDHAGTVVHLAPLPLGGA